MGNKHKSGVFLPKFLPDGHALITTADALEIDPILLTSNLKLKVLLLRQWNSHLQAGPCSGDWEGITDLGYVAILLEVEFQANTVV